MTKILLFLLLLACIAEALPLINLEGKAFVFPKRTDNSYVLLKPGHRTELDQFTICLSFFSDVSDANSLFSAASRAHDNEILIYKNPQNYEIWVANQVLYFYLREDSASRSSGSQWENVCLTWESSTGIVQLWVNGMPFPRKVAAKGARLKTELIVMLGQEQDSYGSSLDAKQAFAGEMAEVYMWDRVLPTDQLRILRTADTPSPLVDWSNLNFETRGEVLTEDTLF